MKSYRIAAQGLACLMLVTTGLGIAPAQADSRRDQDLMDWGRRQGYDCQLQSGGVFCRDKNDDDRFRSGRSRGQVRDGRIEEGTTIETKAASRDRIVLEKNETLPLTLYVDQDLRDDYNRYIVIPRESRIEGRLRPKNGGVYFVADHLVLRNGRRYSLKAESNIIYPDRQTGRSSAGNSRVTDAARAILSSVLGGSNSRIGDVFGRSDEDIFRSSRRSRDVVVIYPNQDLDLRLTSDLRIR
ncbi:MAG: hypothetical protein ACFCU8_04370 [Thermosynechococcaceae cyanobacterium]